MTKRRCWLAVLSLIAGLAWACAAQDETPYAYAPPEEAGDGWETGTLAEVGIDEAPIVEAIDRIRDGTYERVHGLLIVSHGRLVLEEYFEGRTYVSPTNRYAYELLFDRDRIHNLASLTKSITSVLTGAAIANGFIESVDQSVLPLFPEYADLRTPEKNRITVEHLLTMTAGWDWNESTEWEAENDMYLFNMAGDPLRYLIGLDLIAEPGAVWEYNGGAVTLLGKVIEKASGLSLRAFANEYVFGPLGVTQARWPVMRGGLMAAHGDLKLRPRDVAKIGLLTLRNGLWNGERLLPESWIEAATATSYAFAPWEGFYGYPGYGYLWWLREYVVEGAEMLSYAGAGWGGQRMIVLPEIETIVVFTGGNYDHWEPVDEIMERHIVPAL